MPGAPLSGTKSGHERASGFDPRKSAFPDEWFNDESSPHVRSARAGVPARNEPGDCSAVAAGRSWTSGLNLPFWRIDQRREETLHAFADQLRFTEGRVLLAAESAGRRELLLELLACSRDQRRSEVLAGCSRA
jgi:hypothetical protein